MLAFMIKKMLPAVKAHAMEEYQTDGKKEHHGIKKSVTIRDGHEAELLFFPAKEKNAPLLIDFYGGGYIGGNIYKEAPLCERYRDTLDINTAALSYRYGPDYRHPQALEDAYDAILALFRDETFHFDRSKVILEGHSAGAHLVSSIALYNQMQEKLPFLAMILDYPLFDARLKELSKLPKLKYAIQPMVMEMMYHGYFVSEEASNDFLASPILASDEMLKNLPQMYINTCEHDSLKYSAQEFTNRLTRLQVAYWFEEVPGAVHGYVENCSNDGMKALKDYPEEMKQNQYRLYEKTFVEFCDFIRNVTQ